MTKRLIVIHTAECGESANADKGIHNTLVSRRIPVHRIFDADSEIQMLDITAPCGAARGLPRADGIHYEHAGTARQNAEEWADGYSVEMLERSAIRAAEDSLAENIPVFRLTEGADVRGGSGFCGHIDITNAYDVKGGHWDPVPSFPWDYYLGRVNHHRGTQTTTTPKDDDMGTYIFDTVNAIHYHLYGERFRQISTEQFLARQSLARLGGVNIEPARMHPWAIAKFFIDFKLIADPVLV